MNAKEVFAKDLIKAIEFLLRCEKNLDDVGITEALKALSEAYRAIGTIKW